MSRMQQGAAIEFACAPTPKERATASGAIGGAALGRSGRALSVAQFALFVVVATPASAHVSSFLAEALVDPDGRGLSGAMRFAIFAALHLGVCAGFIACGRAGARRLDAAVATHCAPEDWTALLDAECATFQSGAGRSAAAWGHVDALAEGEGMLVARVGASGFGLPDRLLAAAGDPAALRARILGWHAAAHAGSAS